MVQNYHDGRVYTKMNPVIFVTKPGPSQVPDEMFSNGSIRHVIKYLTRKQIICGSVDIMVYILVEIVFLFHRATSILFC